MRRKQNLSSRGRGGSAARVPCHPLEPLESRTLLSAGSLDPSFGTNGELAVQFPGGAAITVVRDSLVQPDGKVVVTGESPDQTDPSNGSDFVIARLNPDGSPDLTFNGTGIFVFPSPGNVDEGSGVAMQSDGKLVVSAVFGETRSDHTNYGFFAAARFNTDGTVDQTFGDGGAVIIDFSPNADHSDLSNASDVLVGPDDKITLVGYSRPDPAAPATIELALARLNPDGTMDDTFGTGGTVLTSVYGDAEVALASAFDASGNIIVGGTSVTSGAATTAPFFTARFLPNGAVDTSFGTNGAVTTSFDDPTDLAAAAVVDAVAVQPDGSIVVGGLSAHDDASNMPSIHLALARYNADGSPDFSFGAGGQIETNAGAFTSINKVLIDSEGRIIASGLSAPTVDALNAHQFSPIVAQYTPDGDLDPTFGTNGIVIINASGVSAAASPASTPGLSALAAASRFTALSPAIVAPADTSQQASDLLRKQSAIVVALQDKLLVVTSTGTELTAAQLIGNGADLSAGTVSGIKSFSVLGGAKAAIAVPVSNVGNESYTGPVTVKLLISVDGTADGSDSVATSRGFAAKLPPGASKVYKLKFAYPTGLPDGSYFVLAFADAGQADVNAANDAGAAPQQVTIARPLVNLGGSFGALPSLAAGAKAKLILELSNTGNVPAKGRAQVAVYASPDASADANDTALGSPATIKLSLKQGATKGVKIPLVLPGNVAPGNYFLIAVINDSALGDSDLANNTLISPAQTQIG